ncbi:MAG: DUF4059 family protein [Streptococcaceae bacterium]|jgi:ribose/xylose/arabinose/galactoside ABC-type transport system permease subunit|nr:DUF4059 family protein [Streptococcaceae bacterium]
MIPLIFEFYVPAFLTTLALMVIGNGIWYLAYIARHENQAQKKQFRYDLLIISLVSTPVLAFAVLAVLVIARTVLG